MILTGDSVGVLASIAGDTPKAGDVVNAVLEFPAPSVSTTDIGI